MKRTILIAAFFSFAFSAQAADIETGKKTYQGCVGCHGATGAGGVGPRLINRSKEDFISKMKKYRSGQSVGPMSTMMFPSAKGLSDDQILGMAEYLQSL